MSIHFEPRDMWIGLFWTKTRVTTLVSDTETIRFYLCLAPCFPISWTWKRELIPYT
jgi:hypothetical protein